MLTQSTLPAVNSVFLFRRCTPIPPPFAGDITVDTAIIPIWQCAFPFSEGIPPPCLILSSLGLYSGCYDSVLPFSECKPPPPGVPFRKRRAVNGQQQTSPPPPPATPPGRWGCSITYLRFSVFSVNYRPVSPLTRNVAAVRVLPRLQICMLTPPSTPSLG